jgi:hypothetical protein
MSSDADPKPQFQEDAVCEVCGKYGAYIFAGKALCADCYEAGGSCCPGFGPAQEKSSKKGADDR